MWAMIVNKALTVGVLVTVGVLEVSFEQNLQGSKSQVTMAEEF